ncbi:MAG: hypothetical protein ABH873_05460 [Candidatus Firestonebacteria bacterium]
MTFNKNFSLEIKTPETVIFEGLVNSVFAPSVIGNLGILPQHTPLLAILKKGKIKFKHPTGTSFGRLEKEYIYYTGDGFIEILPNKVRILVEECNKLKI